MLPCIPGLHFGYSFPLPRRHHCAQSTIDFSELSQVSGTSTNIPNCLLLMHVCLMRHHQAARTRGASLAASWHAPRRHGPVDLHHTAGQTEPARLRSPDGFRPRPQSCLDPPVRGRHPNHGLPPVLAGVQHLTRPQLPSSHPPYLHCWNRPPNSLVPKLELNILAGSFCMPVQQPFGTGACHSAGVDEDAHNNVHENSLHLWSPCGHSHPLNSQGTFADSNSLSRTGNDKARLAALQPELQFDPTARTIARKTSRMYMLVSTSFSPYSCLAGRVEPSSRWLKGSTVNDEFHSWTQVHSSQQAAPIVCDHGSVLQLVFFQPYIPATHCGRYTNSRTRKGLTPTETSLFMTPNSTTQDKVFSPAST